MAYKGKACHGKDVFGRMNFLYQASLLMADKNEVLSSYYGRLCKSVGKRAVLRIDPEVKRTICKKCSVALKPNITAEIALHENNENVFVVICKKCKYRRCFNINSKYNLWLENPSALVGVHEFGKDLEEKAEKLSLKEENKT